jgi:oxaloacetate decarboxylase gamma subunit
MLFGMGTVFTFLTLLVGVTRLMSATVEFLSSADELNVKAQGSIPPLNSKVEPNIVKVIQSAIDQHRGR